MKFNIKDNVAISQSGFVFNPTNGDSFSTNLIGQEILKKLREGTNIKKLTTHLTEIYSIDNGTVEKDIRDFLLLLSKHQLLIDNDNEKF